MSLNKVWNRIQEIIRFPMVVLTNTAGKIMTMQLKYNDLEVRDDIQVCQQFGFVSVPPAGSRVITLNQSGYSGNQVVISTHDPRTWPSGLSSGNCMVYDDAGNSVKMAGSQVTVTGASKVVIIAASEIDVTAPTLTINASSAVNVTTPLMTVNGVLNVVGTLKENGVVVIAP